MCMSMPSATVCHTTTAAKRTLRCYKHSLQGNSATLHTGNKLEELRKLLHGTSPPLNSNGELQGGVPELNWMRAALDWDGRMDLSKKPKKQPGAKATQVDHMRWDLFEKPGQMLRDVAKMQAKGMRSPRDTCIVRTCIVHGTAYLLWLCLLWATYFADHEQAGHPPLGILSTRSSQNRAIAPCH